MKIELFGEMLLMFGERKERHTIPTLKHNSVRIMLWGCLSVSRAGILIKVWRVMKKEESVKNLEENLKQSAAKLALGLGHHFVFKHVSDPKSSWWRATSWRPKWTLLTGLHKALIWILLKIFGTNWRQRFLWEDHQIWRSWRDLPENRLGLLRRYVWEQNKQLKTKRTHGWPDD